MTLVYLFCFTLFHSVTVISSDTTPLKCGRASKACSDGSMCILYSHVCDGDADCKDGSDEENCASTCTKGQFQCGHRLKCIDKEQVCDGEAQCSDRSDELHCSSDGCVHHCDNKNRCLPANFLCDGERDCLDGTDEASCEEQEGVSSLTTSARPSLSTSPLRCSISSRPCKDNSRCVQYDHFCDGEFDCKDQSDEDDCQTECSKGQFQCGHGRRCIDQAQVCDGVPQCQDRSDEQDCSKTVEGCSHHCDSGQRCVPSSFLCDGERDCQDGTDELNCAAGECGPFEFRCRSGQCIEAAKLCDGQPDCPDQSDEARCSKPPVCSTKQRCPHSRECLVPEWVCDGDQDCKDGTDEKDCPVTPVLCAEFQWACKSKTKCIPASWRCDGSGDCDDDSDEQECELEKCAPHQFQCRGGGCVDSALVCNSDRDCADGSDEGGNCQVKCTAEDDRSCSQTCIRTPQGPRCSCASGFRLLEDGVSCEDLDECGAQSRVCSHICRNSPGSFTCDCRPGYTMEKDQRRCKVTGEPLLLSSILGDLFVVGLHSGRVTVLSSSAKKAILSVDYDWSQQRVYWESLDSESIKWSSLDHKTMGTLIREVRADSVAVDWLGRNLYWIDGVNSQIFAVQLSAALTRPDYTVILDEDLDQPRSLALLPQKGLMFWTETGNTVKIERAGMDGSGRRAVVTSSLGWPVGVAVDAISDRVYWTDQSLRAIGSATLDGEDIQILQTKDTTNPFALAIFNDELYWSDTKRRVVQEANKVTGKNRQVLLKQHRQPFGVKIMHPLLQTATERPCEAKGCSHLCVLAPGPRAVCKCPYGLLLSEDGLTCSSAANTAFLFLLSPSTVTQVFLQSRQATLGLKDWPEHSAIQLPGINQAAILDYSLKPSTLFVTDDSTTSLSFFTLKDGVVNSEHQLLKILDDSVTALALDWVTLNIYWSSFKQQRIYVTSSTNAHTSVVLNEGIGRVESIALHPQSGCICFANLVVGQGSEKEATVECSNMDGGDRRVVWKDAVRPTSLVFSNNGKFIYWADTGLGTISFVQLDDLVYREIKVGEGLAAVALNDDTLIWMTTGDKTRVWFQDELEQNKMWFEVGTGVVTLKVFSRSIQKGSNHCSVNNGGCSHLCLPTAQGRSCRCAHDHVPLNSTHCVPGRKCPLGSRLCFDQASCQPEDNFCNGHADCPDRSDENCITLKPISPDDPDLGPIHLHNFPLAPSFTLRTRNASSSLNSSEAPQTLDLEQCSSRRCSGRGRCVEVDGETRCECSLLYSGESCERSTLRTLQQPLIYSAMGLLTLVAVVVVIVIFRRKRRNESTSRADPPAVKETSLTEIETKAEPGPAVQTPTTEPDKPEEVVTPVD